MKALLLDNYDSFSHNLLQSIGRVAGVRPCTRRNDEIDLAGIHALDVDCLIVSPGPGRPDREGDFGICAEAILRSGLPTLGVCLGHQGIGHLAGALVRPAPEPMHGRVSEIFHDGSALFEGIPSPFRAVRYHSLMLPKALPPVLRTTAWTEDGLVMAIEHVERPLWGVQFHPESILSEYGDRLIENFLRLAGARGRVRSRVAAAPMTSGPDWRPESSGPAMRVFARRLDLALDCDAAFARLYGHGAESFWLDSARVIKGYSRFSFMGDASGPRSERLLYDLGARRLSVRRGERTEVWSGSIFDYLRQRLGALRVEPSGLPFDFTGGWVGYFGYELKALCGAAEAHRATEHDAGLLFVDRFVAVDHAENAVWLVHLASPEESKAVEAWMDRTEIELRTLPSVGPEASPAACGAIRPPPRFRPRHGRAAYLQRIREAQTEIRLGESYEVCLTNEIRCGERPEPLALYRSLRRINPAPYAALLRFPGLSLLSSSPERFLKIDRDGRVEAKPIKGTMPRGRDADEDRALARALAESEKDRAENLMIVDLLRNDLGAVCEIGSVHVPRLMVIESYQTVHQMVSTVAGRLAAGRSPIDAVVAAFPGGSMTGAPKLRTMEIIDRLEGGPRGVYSGAIGYVGVEGTVDLNIVIRTIVLSSEGVSIGCGGAITHLSDPDAEYEEMRLKSLTLVRAIEAACGFPEASSRRDGVGNHLDPGGDLLSGLMEPRLESETAIMPDIALRP